MTWNTIEGLKDDLKKDGFDKKAVLSDDDMTRVGKILDQDGRNIATPGEELRYIEGLLRLPMGYLHSFRIIPKFGHERCKCGRVPSALDIVYHAFCKRIHEWELIRDTLIGFSNIFEIAEEGRTAECYRCGRPVILSSYYTRRYMYA